MPASTRRSPGRRRRGRPAAVSSVMSAAGVCGQRAHVREDVRRRLLDAGVGLADAVAVERQTAVPVVRARGQDERAARRGVLDHRRRRASRESCCAPLFWIRSPVTGEADSVLTPAGSRPLATRASHSQPTRFWPIVRAAARRLGVEAGVAIDAVGALRRVDDEREVLRVVVADVHLAGQRVLRLVRARRVAPRAGRDAARVRAAALGRLVDRPRRDSGWPSRAVLEADLPVDLVRAR